ncbi:MAG: DUF5689 domain-containing protein [Bacteroidota bacterium]
MNTIKSKKMKQVNFIKYLAFLGALMIALMTSCVDEDFDMPPENTLPEDTLSEDGEYTIQELKELGADGDYVFSDTASVFGVVTMDDKLGNIYKTAYIQDETGAIALHQSGFGGIYQGDSVRVYLKGLQVGTYNKLFQIDAPDGEGFSLDSHIVKLDVNVEVQPKLVSIPDLKNNTPEYQGELVKLENVQFISADTSKTFADTTGENQDQNTYLIDNEGNTVMIRTSGFANFAGEPVPDGNGSFIGILSQYREDRQLLIRNPEELEMEDPRFLGYVQTFDDESFGNWTTYSVTGDQEWEIGSQGSSTPYAVMSGHDGEGNNKNEDWLISPRFNLNKFSNEQLSFWNACNYSGSDLQVKYSTDYPGNGENPNDYTWTDFSGYNLSSGDFTWVESGNIDLSGIVSSNVHIAFKYTSTNDSGKTWEVDDIKILGEKD